METRWLPQVESLPPLKCHVAPSANQRRWRGLGGRKTRGHDSPCVCMFRPWLTAGPQDCLTFSDCSRLVLEGSLPFSGRSNPPPPRRRHFLHVSIAPGVMPPPRPVARNVVVSKSKTGSKKCTGWIYFCSRFSGTFWPVSESAWSYRSSMWHLKWALWGAGHFIKIKII